MAADGGYLRNLEDKRGKPARWVTGEPLPESVVLLPDPTQLATSATTSDQECCGVAVESEEESEMFTECQTDSTGQAALLTLLTDADAPPQETGPPPGFTPPSGPGRCADCGFHTATQGHRDNCPANERTTT